VSKTRSIVLGVSLAQATFAMLSSTLSRIVKRYGWKLEAIKESNNNEGDQGKKKTARPLFTSGESKKCLESVCGISMLDP
jgi:hypothetical protein